MPLYGSLISLQASQAAFADEFKNIVHVRDSFLNCRADATEQYLNWNAFFESGEMRGRMEKTLTQKCTSAYKRKLARVGELTHHAVRHTTGRVRVDRKKSRKIQAHERKVKTTPYNSGKTDISVDD